MYQKFKSYWKINDFANVHSNVGINQFLDEDDLIALDYPVNVDD